MELIIGITGSNGFMGRYLTNELDILGIRYVRFSWDLLNKEDVKRFFFQYWVNSIIHLVWTFDEPFDNQMRLNFETTKNILEIWSLYGLKKLIYASTGAVYGEPLSRESIETDQCRPNTFYGLSKKITEDLILYYIQNHALVWIILRFPNVYWKWNNKWVIYNFQSSIEKNNTIVLYWDWKQSRNFLYVVDAVQGIIKSIDYPSSTILNISNPLKVSINDLIDKFSKKYDFKVEKKLGNNNLKDLLLSIDRAKKEIWFSPNYPDIVI